VPARLAYYISAHGYGHGVRSSDILRCFLTHHPDAVVTVVSDLPSDFLQNRLGRSRVRYRKAAFDVGMIQRDSIRVDVDATLAAALELCRRRPQRIEEEVEFLRRERIGLLVADIPAIPLEAAARAGLPRLAVGNFAWDWIYSPFVERNPEWAGVVAAFAEGYRHADLLLRLPFHEPMSAFPRHADLTLVASPGRHRRAELAAATGCDPAKKWILLSFTSLDWADEALARVEQLTDYEFLTVRPLEWKRRNLRAVSRETFPFSDVVASADAVISKPGFGLLSDCIVNRKPLLYAERTDFQEYPILVEAVETYLQNQHIPARLLYRGELAEYLDLLWRAPKPPGQIAHEGAEQAARRIAEFL